VIKSGEGHSDLTTILIHIHTKYEGTCTQYKYNIDLFDIEVNIQGHNLISIQDTLTWGIYIHTNM
jgi:hypothetical protein